MSLTTLPISSKLTIVILLLLLSLAALYSGIYFWQPRPLLRLIARLSPDVLYFVTTDSMVVALTIDDGPHADVTPPILDVLKRNQSKATFFIIGTKVRGNESILDRIRSDGHELANHLATDFPSVLLSTTEFERQLLAVDEEIGPLHSPKWFRPGFAWYSRRMISTLADHGYRICLGSVYPHDTKLRSVTLISRYILARVFPGAVIVLHDGSPDRIRTAEVLERVLPELKRRGYRTVTLSEMAGIGAGDNDRP